MSFPLVFEHGGEIYMIPETCVNRRVEVWRATRFPFEWTLHATALEGQIIGDTPLHRHDGQWWLFANIAQAPDGDLCNELHLFAVDGPDLKSVVAHTRNPVVIDCRCARNAGRPFYRDGLLLRPSQNNAHNIYGYGLNFMRITALSTDHYEEEMVSTATPAFEHGLVRVHHYDGQGDVFVFDICYKVGGWGKPTEAACSRPQFAAE
jgi:hypothetical protein